MIARPNPAPHVEGVDAPSVAILLDRFGSGGVERVACHLANGLARRGFAVAMVVNRDTGPIRGSLDDSVTVRTLRSLPGLGRKVRLLSAALSLARYLRNARPDVFHSPGNHTHHAALLGVQIAGYRGAFVPKLTNPIVRPAMAGARRRFRLGLYRRLFRRADRLLVLSPKAVAATGAIWADAPAKAVFVHNPYIDADMLARARARDPAVPPRILSVGRLSRQKNHAMLLRSLALLAHRSWELVLCGEGPEETNLRKLAVELGIVDRVRFAGFVRDIASQYARATVTALPSRFEDLPATLVEAIACGCPVVTTASSQAVVGLMEDIGGYPPVPVDDHAALAAAVNDALDGNVATLRGETMNNYRIDRSCDEHARIFHALTGRGGAGA